MREKKDIFPLLCFNFVLLPGERGSPGGWQTGLSWLRPERGRGLWSSEQFRSPLCTGYWRERWGKHPGMDCKCLRASTVQWLNPWCWPAAWAPGPACRGDSISVRILWEMEQFHSNLGQIHSSLEQIYARIEPPSPPKIILEDMIWNSFTM